jgi:Ca2+-transporting ATPase
MIWATSASLFLMLLVVYVPFFQPFFGTVPLTVNDWLMMLPFMFMAPVAAEITKIFLRRRRGDQAAPAAVLG